MSETQSAEIVPVQSPQPPKAEAENTVQPPSPVSPSSAASAGPAVSLDSLSKLLAFAFAFLYLTGFLITSLHDFQYGFSEMNPFRPRILAAGSWFVIFIALPSSLIWELKKESVRVILGPILKFSLLAGTYMFFSLILVTPFTFVFTFDTAGTTPSNHPWWYNILILLALSAVAFVLMVGFPIIVSKLTPKLRQWFIFGIYGSAALEGYFLLFVKHSFTENAIFFWFLMAGAFAYFELSQRNWIPVIGAWYRTLFYLSVLVTIFATVYYPHIKAKWGGGALIPVELRLSKDAPTRPGASFACSLIDETDAGFYVIGSGDAFATFIPRSEISSIYYGQGKSNSIFEEGISGESQSKPNNLPASAKSWQQIHSATATRPQAKIRGDR